MKSTRLAIPDVILHEPIVVEDSRGIFECYNQEAFQQTTGLNVTFAQDFHSHRTQNVLRGLSSQILQNLQTLTVEWPGNEPVLSAKDRQGEFLAEAEVFA